MNYKFHILVILLLTGNLGTLRAQTGEYKFTRIDNRHGLSHNQVNCILKDSKGFMWFGTMTGLNRYDGNTFKTFRHDIRDSTSINNNYISSIMEGPEQKLLVDGYYGLNVYNPNTEKFDTKATVYLRQYGLPDADVNKIAQDKSKRFWFLHARKGIYVYNAAQKNTFQVMHKAHDTLSIHSNQIADFAEDKQGNFWLIHTDGVLEKLNGKTLRVMLRTKYVQKKLGRTRTYAIFVDADGDPWIYLPADAQGVFYFDTEQRAFTHFNRESGEIKLNTNLVRCITQDDQKRIWVGTDHGGINLINKKDFSVKYLLHHPEDEKSLSQNSIYALYKDNNGIIWAGTYKDGINYYHRNLNKFAQYQQQRDNPFSLPFNDVNCFVEDAKGNIWIGSNGGGLIYFDRAAGKFKQFLHNPKDPHSLSNNIIVGLYLDRNQKLWVGTYFGGLNVYDGQKFTHYRHNATQPQSLTDDRVWKIFEDSENNLWVGTMGGGLDLLDRKTGTFNHYRADQPNSVNSDYIFNITEDNAKNLWIATAYGVNKYNLNTKRFAHYVNDNGNPQGLSNNNTTTVMQDSRGLLWIATNEGLNLFNPQKNTFRIFRKEDGLADNYILSLLEDGQRNIWLSTPKGLSCLNIKKEPDTGNYAFKFKNYDESDGLQGKVFNTNAALKTLRGELIFGGANGFNLVNPVNIEINRTTPKIVFTDFQIFNESLTVGSKLDKRVILDSAIYEKKVITLPYDQNMFSVSFVALSFLQPDKNRYAYILEGFNRHWLTTGSELRKATFTNLDPGTYTLRVRGSNNDGIWNQEGISLQINILPPFWQTKTAIVLYVVLVLLALWLARHVMLERERLKFRIVQERQEAQRRHEMDVMKIRFFTNVSHEFRTPLTLILTPLEKIISNTPTSDQKNHLLLIHRNARRLLNLVNQLLDFRKMEVQEIALHPTKAEIVRFMKEIVFSFSDLSEKKHINFSFVSRIEEFETYFDQDKLEKILFNLLSNAFKFTPDNGSITVELELYEPANGAAEKQLKISVTDTGIGIPIENQEKIFKRFFQSDIPDSMVNQGSGIGLSITKRFVKLHGGTIRVQSRPGEGSCFTVTLPIKHAAPEIPLAQPGSEEITILAPANPLPKAITTSAPRNTKKPVVLLIEDNEDFRFYLKDNLQSLYHVLEAPNGKLGWQLALAQLPDLIVSDVMMPEMDGLTLNRKLKKDPRTLHIPVILLTANATEEQRLAGYENGANAYITKPFNFEILLSRIKNLIGQQEAYRQTLLPKLEVKPQDIQITSLDDKLIRKAMAYTEKNIANPDFSVEELSRELGMSRVYLYKKLLAITGKAPLEFIRTVRLKRAAQLLLESQLTVAEVAYEVGFNNPKYFTKYFKAEFNCLPSAYAAQKKSETEVAKVAP